jgi:CHAT domain-containing protein/tetratricopeptide (TPR) repeat protein
MIDFQVPIVGEALGGSFIWEEYKGNFTEARSVATSALQHAFDTPSRARALIALAIVQMLQGDLTEAHLNFEKAESSAVAEPDLQYIAFTFDHVTQMYQYRLGPTGGIFTTELEQRWDGVAFASRQESRLTELRAGASGASAHMQSALLFHVLSMMPVHRQVLDNSLTSLKQEQRRELAGSMLQTAWQFQQMAANAGTRQRVLAFVDLLVSDLARRAGLADVAVPALQRSLQLYANDTDEAGAACCQMTWGDWNAASCSSPIVWNLILKEGVGDGSNLTWIDEQREFVLEGADLNKAREAYDLAEAGFSRAGAQRGCAAVKLRHAWLSILDNNFKPAANLFEESQQLAEDFGDHLLGNLARVSALLARTGVSHRYADLTTMRDIGRWGATSGSIAFATGLGLLTGRVARHFLLRRGDYQTSSACYRMAKALYEGLGMALNEASTCIDIGNLYGAIGARSASIEAYEAAWPLLEQTANVHPKLKPQLRRSRAEVDARLYKLYESAMDSDGIERILTSLSTRVPSMSGPAGLPSGMGALVSAFLTGSSDEAPPDATDQVMDMVVHQFTASTVETGRVTAPLYRALKEKARGRAEEAEQNFAAALESAQGAHVADRDFLEAVVFGQKREYEAAVAAYERFLKRGSANAGFVGNLVEYLGSASATGEQERKAQEQRNHELAATFMLRCKRYDKALEYFSRVEEFGGRDWWTKTDVPWEVASDYGETFEGVGQYNTALDWYNRGIDRLERNRALLTYDELKIALASQRSSRFIYFNAARVALKLKEAAQPGNDASAAISCARLAFSYAEAGRARALLDLLASEQSASDRVLEARGVRQRMATWKGLLAQAIESGNADTQYLATLKESIAQSELELEVLERQLLDSDEARALDARGRTMALSEVSQLLDDETCLLQYTFLSDEVLMWVISSEGMIASRLLQQPVQELTFAIQKLRDLCEGQSSGRPTAALLGRQLLEPVASSLGRFRRVMIVPHGAAHYLPFHLLPLAGELFGARHTLSYLPTASILKYIARPWNGIGASVLVVGNPSNMRLDNPSGTMGQNLPYAETEASMVASFFADADPPLIGKNASRDQVVKLMQVRRVLHFATHGHLDAEPALSCILLANGENLSVLELSGMKLDADLVVLSACETGRGEVTGGDDVLGLARAFLGAGVRALVMSLWEVDDSATLIFVQYFYRFLRDGHDPASALSRAQASLRNMSLDQARSELNSIVGEANAGVYNAPNWGNPYYWAAFVLIGSQS